MIPVIDQASFRYLLRHPWQLALALLGISIGVAAAVIIPIAIHNSGDDRPSGS